MPAIVSIGERAPNNIFIVNNSEISRSVRRLPLRRRRGLEIPGIKAPAPTPPTTGRAFRRTPPKNEGNATPAPIVLRGAPRWDGRTRVLPMSNRGWGLALGRGGARATVARCCVARAIAKPARPPRTGIPVIADPIALWTAGLMKGRVIFRSNDRPTLRIARPRLLKMPTL